MSSSSLTVDQLPLELLASILENLPLPDLLRASQTCCCFLDAGNIAYSRQRLNQLETCAMEGGKTFVAARFCEVYEKLMYHFRFVLGTWKIVSTCYGGLMHVKFDGYKIVGTRYYAPAYPHLTRPLRPVKQFIIQISQSGQCQCICYRGFHGPHVSSIEQFESDGFCLKCDDTNVHFHDERDKAAYDALLRDELRAENSDSEEVNAFVLELYQQKLQTLLHEAALQCLPLTLPGHTDNVIIQPGLFKGTYSAHGLEIVLLTYNDQHEAVITKITIPVSVASFCTKTGGPEMDMLVDQTFGDGARTVGDRYVQRAS